MSKVPVTYEYLCNLATHARRVGTLDVFADVALQWAGLAEKEIGRLTANIKKANDQAEHFEREWYLRGDEIERLRAALVAAMEIVQKERVRLAYNSDGAPPGVADGYASLLSDIDAIIAQADAAMGRQG